MNISIISSSVRHGRNSHRVSLYFKNYLNKEGVDHAEILDLNEYQFPIFEERLRFMPDAPAGAREFAEKIKNSDGVIIVTPEYNGGYPASLKNVTDLLYDEWRKKPLAIVTVSAGPFGGSQVLTSLQFSLWKIGAWTVPAMFPVQHVEASFNAEGQANDKEATDKRAAKFITELRWCMKANQLMKDQN